MGDALIGLGVVLAILGPLLLVPVVWLVYRFVTLPLVRGRWAVGSTPGGGRGLAFGLAAFAVGAVMLLSYLPGRIEYQRLCARHATPVVADRVDVEGFYSDRLFPYEAGRFLRDGTFEFVEASDPYDEGVRVRYTTGRDGQIVREEVSSLRSRYGVRQDFVQGALGTSITTKVAYELRSSRELARAGSVLFDGGPLSLFLGAYGMSSCPDIRSTQGSEDFRVFYELERHVLRATG